jgi:predicted MFS family arabinose efflux permease
MTFGEIFYFPFPFLNSLAFKSAKKGNIVEYMTIYTMAFSFAHILGHNTGLHLIKNFGYNITWCIMSGILIICLFLLIWHKNMSNNESSKLISETNEN